MNSHNRFSTCSYDDPYVEEAQAAFYCRTCDVLDRQKVDGDYPLVVLQLHGNSAFSSKLLPKLIRMVNKERAEEVSSVAHDVRAFVLSGVNALSILQPLGSIFGLDITHQLGRNLLPGDFYEVTLWDNKLAIRRCSQPALV